MKSAERRNDPDFVVGHVSFRQRAKLICRKMKRWMRDQDEAGFPIKPLKHGKRK
jgi:predicted rRNA methylase YqxC with S4 and FtsJ domains